MTSGLYRSTIVALLASPGLRKRLAAIAARKAALLEPLRAADDREAIQRRIETGLEGVARRMAEEMAAKIESPRLIRCAPCFDVRSELWPCSYKGLCRTYGLALQTFFARLYNLGIHCSVEEIANVRASLRVIPFDRLLIFETFCAHCSFAR